VPALVPYEREEIRAILVDDPNARFASISSFSVVVRRQSAERLPATVAVIGIERSVHSGAPVGTGRHSATQCRRPFAEELATIANVPDHQLRCMFRRETPAERDVAVAHSDG
jgi:hypothetical protein